MYKHLLIFALQYFKAKTMKLGIIREGKNPPDKRVPLTPKQCVEFKNKFPNVELAVQPSEVRKFKDDEYEALGIRLQEDLSDCDVLMGVKEVPLEMLIPNKTYFFFSHTFKLQPYNAKLLREILDKKIRLVDYEVIKDENNKRLIGFGRYAGIVGCYNGFRTYGLKHSLFDLKPAHECEDRDEMEGYLEDIKLPSNFKCVLTGHGRVGKGAIEIIQKIGLSEVSKEEFLSKTFNEPVFAHLGTSDYNERSSDGGFDKSEFYKNPELYRSSFPQYAHKADLYLACHYWGEGAPFIYTREDMKHPEWKVSAVADISCDIDGPVASTIRPSTIAKPIYGYHKIKETEVDFKTDNAVAVMAVDNLPCELPKDASEDFGKVLLNKVLPCLFNDDPHNVIGRASETTLDGNLTEQFSYLGDYANS